MMCLDQQVRQRDRIPESQIKPLPGNRMDTVRRIAHQCEPRVDVAMRQHRGQSIAPSPSDRPYPAEMRAQPAHYLIAEAPIIERQHTFRDAVILSPHDRRHVGSTARLGIRARAHGQLRERTCRKEMLQCRIAMRDLMADRTDDAGLPVRQPRQRNAGRIAERRVSPLGGNHQPASQGRPPGNPHVRIGGRSLDRSLRRREHRQCRQLRQAGVQRSAKTTRLHHPPEWSCVRPRFTMIEMQEQPRGRLADTAVAYPDVENWTGWLRQYRPQPGRIEQVSRPGGDCIGAAVECRMLHRRQCGAIDHGRGNARLCQAASQCPAYGPGADHADFGLDGVVHCLAPPDDE